MQIKFINTLLQLVVITTLASSCAGYHHKVRFNNSHSNSMVKALLNELAVDDKLVVQLKEERPNSKGKVLAINDSSMIIWKRNVVKSTYIIEDWNDVEVLSKSDGLRLNERMVIKLKNGKSVPGRLTGFANEQVKISTYSRASKGFVDDQISYQEIDKIRLKEGIRRTIEYQELERIKYDENIGGKVLNSMFISSGALLISLVFAIAVAYGPFNF